MIPVLFYPATGGFHVGLCIFGVCSAMFSFFAHLHDIAALFNTIYYMYHICETVHLQFINVTKAVLLSYTVVLTAP